MATQRMVVGGSTDDGSGKVINHLRAIGRTKDAEVEIHDAWLFSTKALPEFSEVDVTVGYTQVPQEETVQYKAIKDAERLEKEEWEASRKR